MAGSQQGWRSSSGGGSGGGVQSVSGLNTNNSDPLNPIVRISVDGTTITGLGTPASPLVATGGGGGGVTSVTGSSPIASSGGATPNISIPQANGTTDGYLSSSDWTTFNNKLSSAFNQQIQDEGSNVNQRNIIDFIGAGVNVTDTGSKTQVTISGNQGTTPYYMNLSVSESPYSQFSSVPTTAPQQSVSATISGGATTTIASFQTPTGIPNTTNLLGGQWTFFLHFTTPSSSTDFTIYVEVYKRTNAGVETLILTTDSVITQSLGVIPTMILTDGVLPTTTLLTTDRIVVKVVVINNDSNSHNITFYSEGTTNYSVSYTTLGQSVPSGAVTSVTASAPVTSSGGTTPNIAMPQANGTTDGYLSSSDWTTFNNKLSSAFNQQIQDEGSNVNPRNIIDFVGTGVAVTDTGTKTQVSINSGVTSVTASSPIASSGGATPNISIPQANGTTDGYLSSSDWTTFNNKLSSAFNQQIQDEGSNVNPRNIIDFVGTGVAVTDTGTKTQVSINSGVTSVTGSSPIASSGGATPNISISQANSSTDGFLSSADWTTFNNKTSKVVFNSQSLSSSPLTLTHNLNTRAVQVEVYDSTTFETIIVQVVRNTLNTIQVTSNSLITADIIIIG